MEISYGKQTISRRDVKKVARVLKRGNLTTGPKVGEFEKDFSKYVGSKYAVAVSNGTAALHLVCLALGLKEGDEVITTPMTFVASSNCILYCGAKPVFVDIKDNGLIDENKIKEKISKKTKAIICVHYGGNPCEMETIKRIAKKANLKIVEDACHALGAKYKNSQIGDCTYSDFSVFSFHPVKHITTGEGGMITTNNKEFYEKLLRLRSHGIEKKSRWIQDMVYLGYNYRITDFQCALGMSQLKKIKKFIRKRREIAQMYDKYFKENKNFDLINEEKDNFNSYHLYVIKLKNSSEREKLYDFLKNKGIFCQVHYLPVYWHSYYQKLGYKKGICPKAEDFYNRILTIPIFPKLAYFQQKYVINQIDSFFKLHNE